MEGDRKTQVQLLRRLYESNRLQEELWKLAYERIWPAICLPSNDAGKGAQRRAASTIALAKGA